jgi:monoamine oxidase
MKVIIIGAGAAGLMAAHTLAKKKVKILLLEAEGRIGGRIHTLTPPGFTNSVEAGAEFIHGKLPLTLQLFKKAGLPVKPVEGEMLSFDKGRLKAGFGESKAWGEFFAKAALLNTDCTLDQFLSEYFSAHKYDSFRDEARAMAQGLDLADSSLLSVLSIRDEWASEETEYRPLTGYMPLLEFLKDSASGPDFQIRLNKLVKSIEWEPGAVNVYTQDELLKSDAVIIALPLSAYHRESIVFQPALPAISRFFQDIGLGEVIKLALEFDYAFWEDSKPEMGFLFTESGFTFWTQLSLRKPVLMGWLGNSYAAEMDKLSDARLIEMAINNLSTAFNLQKDQIELLFKAGIVFRYTKSSVSGGGYSYLKPQSRHAIKQINKGVGNTIWFAGESLHPTYEAGTVEAALQSGRFTANKIIKALGLRS